MHYRLQLYNLLDLEILNYMQIIVQIIAMHVQVIHFAQLVNTAIFSSKTHAISTVLTEAMIIFLLINVLVVNKRVKHAQTVLLAQHANQAIFSLKINVTPIVQMEHTIICLTTNALSAKQSAILVLIF